MGLFDFLGSGGAEKPIDAVGNVVEKTGNALDSLFTSDDEKLSHKEIMERIKNQPAEFAQELNLINARDESFWNSGWRPALGWVGAVSMASYYIPQYLVATYIWASLCVEQHAIVTYPINDAGLWQLVTLLIGGKVLRTVEKSNGTA